MRCHTTFDNLPRGLWPRYSAPSTAVREQRYSFLADVLFNSAWMERSKVRVRNGVLGDLRRLVDTALYIQSQNLSLDPATSALATPSPLSTRTITKRLCTALALAWADPLRSCYYHSSTAIFKLNHASPHQCAICRVLTPRWRRPYACKLVEWGADALCVGVIVGAEGWVAKRLVGGVEGQGVWSTSFGRLRGLMRERGTGVVMEEGGDLVYWGIGEGGACKGDTGDHKEVCRMYFHVPQG